MAVDRFGSSITAQLSLGLDGSAFEQLGCANCTLQGAKTYSTRVER